MSELIFENDTTSNNDHSINVLIKYNSYEDMLHWKDRPIQEICKEMNLRTKNEVEKMLEERAIDKAMNSDKVWQSIGKMIER